MNKVIASTLEQQPSEPTSLGSNVRRFMLNYKNDIMFLVFITVLFPYAIYLIPTSFDSIPLLKLPFGSSKDTCKAFGYTGPPSTSINECMKDPTCSKTLGILEQYHANLQSSGVYRNSTPSILAPNISIQILPSTKDVPLLSTGLKYDGFVSLPLLRNIEERFNSRIKAIATHFNNMSIAGLSFKVKKHVILDEIQTYRLNTVPLTLPSKYSPITFLMPIGYMKPESMSDLGFNDVPGGFYDLRYLMKKTITSMIKFPVGYVVLKSGLNPKSMRSHTILHEIFHAWLNHGYPYSDKDNHYRKAGYYQEGILSKLLNLTLSKQERLPYARAYRAICLSNVMLYYKYCLDKRFLDMLTSQSLFKREYYYGTLGQENTIPQHMIPHILVHHLTNVAKSSYLEKLAKCDILYNYKEPIDWLAIGFYTVSAAVYYELISYELNNIYELDSDMVFSDWNKDPIASIGNYVTKHDDTTKSEDKIKPNNFEIGIDIEIVV